MIFSPFGSVNLSNSFYYFHSFWLNKGEADLFWELIKGRALLTDVF